MDNAATPGTVAHAHATGFGTGWTCNACGQQVRLDRPHDCPNGNNQGPLKAA